ncbi:hypothetical protein BDZ97DRAFT_108688 [Flammula alnicola]|nr:hypothetical protein BDZ97DRAFT_108688 [Flammula alnicola]
MLPPNSMGIVDYGSPSTARDIRIHDYLYVFAISLLYYDHAITSNQEIEYLWRRPKNRSSYWFFVNRYLAFFGNIAVSILGFTTLSSQVCKRYSMFRQALLFANQVVVCILLTWRIYALYGRSMRILACMIGSGAIMVTISLWALFAQKTATSENGSGCHVGVSNGTAIRLASAWEALFAYDSIIFTLTFLKTWRAQRDHAITGINIPLLSLILRDGAIYFAVMALCNLANILTFYLAGPFLRGSLSTFASSISVTMMSRLVLNLHRTADVGLDSVDPTSTYDSFAASYYLDDTLDIVSSTSVIYDAETSVRRSQSRRRRAHINDTTQSVLGGGRN